MDITVELVKQLITEQFPDWKKLAIRPVEKSGHDNRTFHLGTDKTVRLPSGKAYASQIEKELRWLPEFQTQITCTIQTPVAKGLPSDEYPYFWSINQWLVGETLTKENVTDASQLAKDLAQFLAELQAMDASKGPVAGAHNFYRGGDLSVYAQETKEKLIAYQDFFPVEMLENIWDQATQSQWQKTPVWVHGDVAVGNLLVAEGRLSAVIDFGVLGVGDPACDYVMAWTYFDTEDAQTFKEALNCDDATWQRAKGWALWKALISYHPAQATSEMSLWAKRTIDALLADPN